MPFAPSTIVKLCNVPLQSDNKNQLDFTNVTAQTNYFNNNVIQIFTDFTYQRKESVIRVPIEADLLYNCNYVMYDNANFTNKWLYAFIERIEYINPNCTHLHIRTDVWQTWQFDLTFRNSFIVREHVANDTPFLHTLPEPLPKGNEEIVQEVNATPWNFEGQTLTQWESNYYVAFCASENILNMPYIYTSKILGGIANSLYYYCCEVQGLYTVFDSLNSSGNMDKILTVYPILKNSVNVNLLGQIDGANIYQFSDSSPQPVSINISRNQTFSGYTPKNKKILCAPFNYVRLHNNNGSNVDLFLENFHNVRDSMQSQIYFENFYSANCETSVCCVPKYYKYRGEANHVLNSNSFNFAIEFNAFPKIPVVLDVYKDFLSRHENSIFMMKNKWVANAAENLANKNISGLVSEAFSIGDYYASMLDKEGEPNNVKGLPTGGQQLFSKSAGIFASLISYTDEYLEICDNFFTIYGYNVSQLKTPNFKSRPNHNYIETREIDISGNVPQEDLQQIKNMFNAGVTFWHNPQTFGDYSQNNAPV